MAWGCPYGFVKQCGFGAHPIEGAVEVTGVGHHEHYADHADDEKECTDHGQVWFPSATDCSACILDRAIEVEDFRGPGAYVGFPGRAAAVTGSR